MSSSFLQRISIKHANVYPGASARLERNPAQLTALAPKSSTLSTAWRKVGSSVLYRRVCYAACRGKYMENELTSSSLLYRRQARAKRCSAWLLPRLSPTSSKMLTHKNGAMTEPVKRVSASFHYSIYHSPCNLRVKGPTTVHAHSTGIHSSKNCNSGYFLRMRVLHARLKLQGL